MAVGHCDLADALTPETLGNEFTPEVQDWVSRLVGGVGADPQSWDAKIEPHLTGGWSLDRLAVTDRAILRMACFEFWECPDTPPKSTISEYVELAKRYGSAESGRFVNGVLASVLRTSPKMDWTPPGNPATGAVTESPASGPKPAKSKAKAKPKAKWVVKSDG